MRYAIAVWNFEEPSSPLEALVERFASMGFDALSFLPRQLLDLTLQQGRELAARLDRLSLKATVHGKFDLSAEQVRRMLDLLGPRLLCLTFDAARKADSIGSFFDAAGMVGLLKLVEQFSRSGDLRFGVEDFPLDARALEHYRHDLRDLLGCPRLGILIDVGHMNMRRTTEEYFRRLSAAQYLAGAPLPIIEVHLHDNAGLKDSHAHFGYGNVRFDEVAAGLAAVGFDGVATIEIAPRFYGLQPQEAFGHAADSLSAWRSLWQAARARTQL